MRLPCLPLLCVVWLMAVTATTAAEIINDQSEVVSLYQRGRRLMREGSWLEAARVFEELVGRYPNSPNLDLFMFNRAKASYHFGQLDDAKSEFTAFMNRFPGSPLVSYARFFRGNIAYARGSTYRAFRDWLAAYGATGDERLARLSYDALIGAVKTAGEVKLFPEDFSDLSGERKCKLVNALADLLSKRGDTEQANRLAALCGGSVNRERTAVADDVLDIAFVLPFSGELEQFGRDIYNGGVIAAEMYERQSGRQVKLTTYDTQGDPIEAGATIRTLVPSSADAVIGPLTSQEAAVSTAALDGAKLPMIIPAATDAGLTRLSPAAFQLSPNIELEGIVMADYATERLGADSAAILTSTRREHLRMARAFVERFKANGGEVVAIEYYRPRDKDFGGYVRDIKNTILGLIPDSGVFVNEQGDTLDPDGLPAHVDCLFLPGSANQLRLLLPQIAFYRLHGVLLGTDGWDDQAIYRLGDNITHGAIFASPFLQPSASAESQRFAAAFDSRYGKPPQRLSRLGYDAVHLVAQAVTDRAISRSAILTALAQTRGYGGAAGGVTFGPDRDNLELPLYRLENGQATRIDLSADTTVSAAPTPDN